MIPTDKDLALMSLSLYSTQAWLVNWDGYYPESIGQPICWAHKVLCGLNGVPTCRIIVFRGTSSFLDVLADADLELEEVSIGNIHSGFYNGIKPVVETILSIGDSLPTYVTGHSLGAARAAIVAADINSKSRGKISGKVTWGEPRIGLDLVKEAFLMNVSRSYVMRSGWEVDPVTFSPALYDNAPATTVIQLAPLSHSVFRPMDLHSMAQYSATTPATPLW